MVSIHLINDVDISLAGGNVDAFIFLVKEQIICVARDIYLAR